MGDLYTTSSPRISLLYDSLLLLGYTASTHLVGGLRSQDRYRMIYGLESDYGRYYKASRLELKGYHYALRRKLWPIGYDLFMVKTPRESRVLSLSHVR